MSIFSVPLTIRTTQRLGQIALVLMRHGFGPFVRRIKLRKYIPWSGRFSRQYTPLPGPEPSLGKRMVAAFEELGPIFIKLGQLLSSRPDILPPEIVEDLKLLQDRVTPFPTEQAYQIIKQDLKRDVQDLFEEFNHVPLASGSIAQTYLAKTRNGRQVVVKIRRPNIEHVAKLDLHLLKWGAINVQKHIPELNLKKAPEIIDEFAATLHREMDFLNEASTTERIGKFFTADPNVVVPVIKWDLCSSRILTMTYITGKRFHEGLADTTVELDKPKLARILIETFMRQVLELGVFHADPHPGNFMIIPPDRIGMVDFGMAGQLDSQRNAKFVMLLTAAHYRYMDIVTDLLWDMNAMGPDTDAELLKRDLAIMLDKWKALPLKNLNLHSIFYEIATLARDHNVVLPRDFVLIGKSLAVIGGTAFLLDKSLNPTDVIAERVHEAAIKLFGREYITKESIIAAWHGGLLLKELPHYARDFSRQLLRGQLKFSMELLQMDNFIKELDKSSNRLSFSMIVASIIIGSSLIFNTGGFRYLALTGYVVAGIMGLWLVVAIIRSGKLS